jgi:flagellar assembly factor FliW
MKTTLVGTRFGTIEFDGEEVLEIEGGLVGLSDLRHFVMFEAKPGSPFSWLQSLDDPSMAFLVAEPGRYVGDYESEVARRCPQIEDAVVLATATVPAGRPVDTTLNLSGPIVIDAITRVGKQMVLDDAAYTTRYRVFAQSEPEARLAA